MYVTLKCYNRVNIRLTKEHIKTAINIYKKSLKTYFVDYLFRWRNIYFDSTYKFVWIVSRGSQINKYCHVRSYLFCKIFVTVHCFTKKVPWLPYIGTQYSHIHAFLSLRGKLSSYMILHSALLSKCSFNFILNEEEMVPQFYLTFQSRQQWDSAWNVRLLLVLLGWLEKFTKTKTVLI